VLSEIIGSQTAFELLADQQIGGKGHPIGQAVDREEYDVSSIGTGPQGSPGLGPPEPYPDGWIFGIMKKSPVSYRAF